MGLQGLCLSLACSQGPMPSTQGPEQSSLLSQAPNALRVELYLAPRAVSWAAIEDPMMPAPTTTTCGPTISCRGRPSAAITSNVRHVSVPCSQLAGDLAHLLVPEATAQQRLPDRASRRPNGRIAGLGDLDRARNTKHAKHAKAIRRHSSSGVSQSLRCLAVASGTEGE